MGQSRAKTLSRWGIWKSIVKDFAEDSLQNGGLPWKI